MFRFDFRLEDLSFSGRGEREIAFWMGLSSGGLAKLGDNEFRFIVDVRARGELKVNDWSTV